MIKLEIKTKIYPTEENEAIFNIFHYFYPFEELFPSKPNSKGEKELYAEITGIKSLHFLFNRVRRQRIVEVARKHAVDRINTIDNTCAFMLNKQALTQGKISLCETAEESPLGPVDIKIGAKNIEMVINYLFPHTEKGKVLEVDYKPVE